MQVGKSVLNGHDDRDDSNNSSINGGSQPSGPSSLRGSRNDEVGDEGHSEKSSGESKRLNGIHGLDGRFDHGKSSDPQRIRSIVEKASPSVSQNIVFDSSLLCGIRVEDVWLRGDVTQVCGDNLGALAESLNVSKSVGVP